MNSSFGSSLQGCWILLSWSSPRKIWFFWSESVLLSTLNKWIKLNFPDFPSDIHLICAYCRSAGRRFLSAAARACSRNHSWFQTSSFSDWMQLTRRPWIRKCLWSKNEWIWGCCWTYAQRIHIARWLNKMAECWDSRHLLSAARPSSHSSNNYKAMDCARKKCMRKPYKRIK